MGEGAPAEMLDQSWRDYANCLGMDTDLFFPGKGASTREAKEVCRGCIVREPCLEYALTNVEKFGIWGGMSESERRRIRRGRALARAAEVSVPEPSLPVVAEEPASPEDNAQLLRGQSGLFGQIMNAATTNEAVAQRY